MKKILFGLIIITHSLTSFADCTDAYKRASLDKLLSDFEAVKTNSSTKHLDHMISAIIRRDLINNYSEEQRANIRVKELLQNGFNTEIFCPIVKTKKNGIEKRNVFGRRALIRYLIDNLYNY